MKRTAHVGAALATVLLLPGCWEDADERYDAGYGDGYAEGYNTTCNIRATLVEGDWSSEAYSRGYNDGRLDGAAACLTERGNQ